ncbi:hypothetical protein EYC84_001733 [Monilinia fructicola]|uniref:Cofilin n=1 Tax=Monilinia fructicola TaxID=38448 RepID=A0A5M9JUH9_MONFR|nr:hypothetical protein EYC84_001733 [Monilinia fructicola]
MQFFTNKSWMYSLTQGQFTPLLASLPSITFDAEHELTNHHSITVDDECIEKFNEMKLQKKIKWIVYKINDEGTKVVVDTSSESADWEPFREVLVNAKALNKNKTQGKGPRYAVYDFNYDLANGEGQRTKLTFISWSPDDATTFPKMMYASTKESFKRALSGLSGDELQANDEADLEENEMLKTEETLFQWVLIAYDDMHGV